MQKNTFERLAALAALGGLAVVTLLLLAGSASAQIAQVYFTYSPVDTGPTAGGTIGLAPGNDPVPLHLWIEGGGQVSPGGPCQTGAIGNEICGFNLTLDANGHYSFVDYQPNQEFDSGPTPVPILANLTGDRLILNGLDFGQPGVGNRYLGVVNVTPIGTPNGEEAVTSSGAVMRSDMAMWNVV